MEILFKPIDVYNYTNKEELIKFIQENRKPLLIRDLDIGPCKNKWTAEYLAETIKDVQVSVHVSPTGKMNFLKKNFTYKKMPFDEFVYRSSREHKDRFKPVLCENEVLYYRSVSFDRRGKECSDLSKHFPSIAGDFYIPEVFNPEDFFSSVFRIASPQVQVWTHYDVMDNILVQIHGSKKVTLFDPNDIEYLYLNGDKSEVIDIYNPDINRFPLFLNAVQHECTMNPGDAIFIPALWFHSTTSNTFSISINVFWKNLPHELYDKNDVYGNKDLLAANKALTHIKKAQESLKSLPLEYRQFYVQRCIAELKRSLAEISSPSAHGSPVGKTSGTAASTSDHEDERESSDETDKPKA